jgi:nucleoid DNA-binding protein
MPRTKVDWRSASKENYNDFCRRHPSVELTFDEWRNIIYTFTNMFREHILETGERAKLPFGFGEFSINKKKRRKMKGVDGKEFVNLPVDWKRTKEKGKIIYNFNFHTEGYFFGWMWFKSTVRLKNTDLWYFKPSRTTSRLLAHYVKVNDKYQHLYHSWKI